MELHPFQEIGRDFLARRTVALLADEMRLGKTAQAVTAARKVGARHVCVVCPAIARTHWRKDWRRWWPDGPEPFVQSYDEIRIRGARPPAPGRDWDVAIVDEAHYCKSLTAKRTKAVLGKTGLVSISRRIWALTGTPAPNHVGELWPLLRVFGVTKLGYYDFLSRYCRVDDTGRVVGSRRDRLPELRAKLKGTMLRRTKGEVAPELPRTEVTPWFVDAEIPSALSEENAALLAQVQALPPDEVGPFLESIAPSLARLRILTALAKVPVVAATIAEELLSGDLRKVVVFGYHREPMEALCSALRQLGVRPVEVHGGISASRRDEALTAFCAGGANVFVGQLVAAGTAIDLSAAHQGILLERDWVPGVNAQAIERMGGWRQRYPVTVRDVVIEGTVDEVVAAAVARKVNELGALVSTRS